MNDGLYDVVIIGAGASGLMLAANLELAESSGIILEGTSFIGSKLKMSGGGHCNITHGGSIKEFVNAYGEAGSSLRRCLYKHNNVGLESWLEEAGIDTVDEGGRIFPKSKNAKDVLEAFVSAANYNKWHFETGKKVCGLRNKTGESWEIEIEGSGAIYSRCVVIASGGVTYPETGSDGSMFDILKKLEIDITEPRSALVPIYVKDYPYEELAGISVSDVIVTTYGSDASCTCKGKSARMTGDLLFTHEAFSGPVMLNISRYAEPGETIRICYNKELADLPKRMQKLLTDRARGESGDVKSRVLASLLDRDDFTVSAVSERGMVSAGGVLLEGMDMKTMRSLKYDSLYVIGEALDADGITGGYNLQMCWSTALTCADALRACLQEEPGK